MIREPSPVAERWAKRLAAILVTLGCGVAGFASAAPGDADSVLTDPKDIAACLCLEQSISARAAEMRSLGAVYNEETRQLADMNADIDRRRPLVNVQDQAQIDAFKVILEQRDQALDKYQWSTLPKYQASVARYNEKVDVMVKMCSGHPLDQVALDQVKQKLTCTPE
jgi:hypothetical protein